MATNVIVAVRARPFNKREKGLDSKLCLKMDDGVSTVITDVTNGESKHLHSTTAIGTIPRRKLCLLI